MAAYLDNIFGHHMCTHVMPKDAVWLVSSPYFNTSLCKVKLLVKLRLKAVFSCNTMLFM